MAKLSLWLLTLARGKPFTFLDHAIRCGDSLVGLTAEQICSFRSDQLELNAQDIRHQLQFAQRARAELADSPEAEPYELKKQKLQRVGEALDKTLEAGDLAIAAFFAGSKDKDREARRREFLNALKLKRQFDPATYPDANATVEAGLRLLTTGAWAVRPFHWEIEFPEVFAPASDHPASGHSANGGRQPPACDAHDRQGADAPRLPGSLELEAAGKEYYEFRAALMVQRNEGLTKTYNRFHDPDETDANILRLRALHAAMDRAVLDAYGWTDIPTACEFLLDSEDADDDTAGRRRKPYRYRWPDDVRDEVLARLLALNKQRAELERLTGLTSAPTAAKKKATRKKNPDDDAPDLFQT